MATPVITVRPATLHDLPGIMACLEALAPVGLWLSLAELTFEEMQRNGAQLYVAVVNGEIAGTATLYLERKLIHRGGIAGRIEDVAVRASQQRQGVGSMLVQRVVEAAMMAGAYKVTLSCRRDRAMFYERLGFREHEVDMRVDCG